MFLDKNCRKILKYFIRTNTPQAWDTIAANLDLTNDKNQDIKIIELSLDFLLEENCIKICGKTISGSTIYKLSNRGKMYYKFLFFQYIYPITTALISLIISLIMK